MNYRQKAAADDPIRYIGSEKADIRFYDGALRHAVGAKHYQVVRANREYPEAQEGYGGHTITHQCSAGGMIISGSNTSAIL